MNSHYHILPSDPSILSLDPLGLCDEDEPSTWLVIVSAIGSFRKQISSSQGIHAIPNLIQDLSYSVHMNGHLDTTFLNQFVLDNYPDPESPVASQILNNILDAALELPSLFPTHRIPYLNQHNPLLEFSTLHIRSLLSHQFLNTLSPPKGNEWGCTFSCWYSGQPPLPDVVSGYLTALFDYFIHPVDFTNRVFYRYHTSPLPKDSLSFWTTGQKYSLFDYLVIEPVSIQSVPFPHEKVTCTLIASNSSPGFGASCTQEELVTAACPPLLPMGALFISPPISPDATIVVQGNMPIFHWTGQGREARFLGKYTNMNHTFVFLDASELDIVTESNSDDSIPDLDPKYLFRDLHKALIGFSALVQLGIKAVASPLWGAGAFGGNPIIKTLILGAAAARAGISIHLSVDKARIYQQGTDDESKELIHILECLKQDWKCLMVEDVVQKLHSGTL
ncbi:hypothetical protein CVT25_013704 [Psilocybe cyanescens]|uniref:poly(ADP-ribose) glycohydrolase n=1 Tax=Psilocybe cyanescens TaxID=93625 RepID=A0A409VTL6_PSICY|nr:hypothetical protein CVT25_013704 [Psilocybe cyanescens]